MNDNSCKGNLAKGNESSSGGRRASISSSETEKRNFSHIFDMIERENLFEDVADKVRTVQYSTVQYNRQSVVQCNTILQCSTVQYSTVRYSAVQYSITH